MADAHASHSWNWAMHQCSCGTTAESLYHSDSEGHSGEHWLERLIRKKAEDVTAGIVAGTMDVTTGEFFPDA